jgi:hypothetical protein
MTTGPRSEVPGAGMGLGYDPADDSETTAEQIGKNRAALRPPATDGPEDQAGNQPEGQDVTGAQVLERREHAADERGAEQ